MNINITVEDIIFKVISLTLIEMNLKILKNVQ